MFRNHRCPLEFNWHQEAGKTDSHNLGQHHDRRFRRFVTMTSINSEPKPGTAFKKIMEEQAMLDEFMAMVKKKYGLIRRIFRFLFTLLPDWRLIDGSMSSII
jgi:hypothetical protein